MSIQLAHIIPQFLTKSIKVDSSQNKIVSTDTQPKLTESEFKNPEESGSGS